MVAVIGLGGVAVLLGLGFWQVQRLAWKEGVLDDIAAHIAAEPVPLPTVPDPQLNRYLPVRARGEIGTGVIRVLASRKTVGAGYRLIVPFTTDGRRVLLDLGFLPVAQAVPVMPQGQVELIGNLHWPDEVDSFTPEPDPAKGLWFAREVSSLAAHLDSAPVLIVLRSGVDLPGVTPLPVGIEGIANDHLQYAITWFSLAAIWLAMTGFLVYRMRKVSEGRP
ncbi:SURF1 family protein [Pseudooceanicola sp.]|uniref:SURF1 family protein n=1 Tax=Pseudooceanicola sp. TaxID=1914328 RepID=UPI002608A00E|nr:SURF1 family protein [Pseudooceanicola sp.]MDF1856205.1 SURF1 family protein [Pseudooceanicola sp.]